MSTNNITRLDELLKPYQKATDVLTEAFAEIELEEKEKKKQAAKELLSKAKGLKDSMVKSRKDFESQEKKFDKELGKVLNRIEAMMRGQPEPTEEEQEKKE